MTITEAAANYARAIAVYQSLHDERETALARIDVLSKQLWDADGAEDAVKAALQELKKAAVEHAKESGK